MPRTAKKATKVVPLITRQEYIADIKVRWQIHTEEVAKLGKIFRKHMTFCSLSSRSMLTLFASPTNVSLGQHNKWHRGLDGPLFSCHTIFIFDSKALDRYSPSTSAQSSQRYVG